MERLRRLAVPLASGMAYALTAARYVQGGDSGELAAVGAAGGVAHPPGYPLYILWCRLWQWLPASSPAHRVGLATAITAALAVFMIERACRAWGARPLASSFAAAIFAISPLAWRLATEPEVFMLNVALALALVTLSAPPTWRHEERRAVALAFCAGLGISNHHSIVLLTPLGILAWARAVRRTERRAVTVGASIGALALGLSPYAYLLRAAGTECTWGDTSTIGGLVRHFLRRDYGTTHLSTSSSEPVPLAQLALLGRSFVESAVALPLVIAAIVAVRRRRWSWDFGALAACVALAGPIFVSRFNLPPHGLNALVVVRFHLLPLALASVLGAFGIDALIDLVRTPFARRTALGGIIAVLVVRAGLSGAEAVTNARPTIDRYLRNVLAVVPPRSVIVATGDDLTGGFEYAQCVLGERRDVVVISPQLMLAEWYGRRVDAELGFHVEHASTKPGATRPSLNGAHLLEELVLSDRPVFLTGWFLPNLDRAFPSYPIGPLIRVVKNPSELPSPPALLRENAFLFASMLLDDTPPSAGTWAGVRYEDYGRPWKVLAETFEKGGDEATAAECRARAAGFTPASSP